MRRATAQTDKLRTDLGGIGGFTSPVTYPDTDFSHKLAGLAAFIAAGLPMRVVTIRASGGYDTHADEAEDLSRGLKETCEGMLAFQRDLEARGLADRVLIELWSEFGRRPEENASLGTDHGAAGCAFVVGSKAKGEMVGEFPGLATARRERQRPRDQRLPRDVLLAAGAVAGARRGLGHPRRLLLPAAGPGEGVSGRGARAGPAPPGRPPLAAALVLGSTAAAAAPAPAAGLHLAAALEDASSSSCGATASPRRVKRIKHWWTCEAQPSLIQPQPALPVAPAPAAPPERRTDAEVGHLGVKAVEYSYTLSRPEVSAGEVIVELNNQGEDPHNLVLEHEGSGDPALEIPSTPSVSQASAHFTLAPGTYRLYCSLYKHEAKGMEATLVVSGS